MRVGTFFITTTSLLLVTAKSQSKFNYPLTEKQTVEDVYFGKKVKDPYRWLEDDKSPNTADWVKRENETTERYLSGIDYRAKIKTRLTELWNYNKQSAPFKKGGFYFCFKNNGLQNQSVLYIKKNPKDEGSVLLDPNTLSKDGTVSLSGIAISKNGKTLAYGLSQAGSDWVEIHFKDITQKKDLPDVLKWVKFSAISWKGNGIYYSRYDEPSGSALSQTNQFHKVYYHQMGTKQEQDDLVYEDKQNANYNFGAGVTDDENYLTISISQSTSGNKLLVKDLTKPKPEFISFCNDFEFENTCITTVNYVAPQETTVAKHAPYSKGALLVR